MKISLELDVLAVNVEARSVSVRLPKPGADGQFVTTELPAGSRGVAKEWAAALSLGRRARLTVEIAEPASVPVWPVGTEVLARNESGKEVKTKTTTPPWQLGHGGWVIEVEGIREALDINFVRLPPPSAPPAEPYTPRDALEPAGGRGKKRP